MSKKKRTKTAVPDLPATKWVTEGRLLAVLWAAAFLLLAFVPDQKILRYKLLSVEAAAGAALAWVFASWAARPEARWVKTPLDVPVALYALGGLLFHVLSPEKGVSSLELVRMLFAAAAFFAAAQTLRRLELPEVPAWAWGLGGALGGAYALLQTRGGLGPFLVPQADRPIFTFGNPIFLAAFLASASALAAVMASFSRGRARVFWAACCALSFAGVWATQTRAALVGLGAAGSVAVVLALRGRRRAAAVGALVLVAAAAAWHFRTRQWTHGLIWRDTLSLWASHPWLGCGLGRFHVEFPAFASPALRALWPESKVIINFAHNEYLQVLAETGAVGGALLAGVLGGWGWLVREAARRMELPRRALVAGLLAAVGTLLVQNFFSPDLRFGVSGFMVFFGLGAAAALGWGEARPVPEFPGRLALGAAGLVAVGLFGHMAAAPLLAQRRLAAEPGFHVDAGDEFKAAVGALAARLKENPADADAAENLGYLYAKAKMWPEAVRAFERTAQLAPERPGPLNNLGNLAYSMGDREKAIAWWEKSLAAGPDQIDARLNLGKTLYEMGRLKESGRNLEEVLKRDPDNEKAQVLLKKMIE